MALTTSPTNPADSEGTAAESERQFLTAFGARVRELRALRGMTRKSLAGEAEVSERHLAQLELGEGNVSVVLLRRVARALNVGLQEFFKLSSEAQSDEELVREFLRTIPAGAVGAILARLRSEFSAAVQTRKERVALIGLRGAGKSTLGRQAADFYGVPFVELDEEVETEAGMALAEIFSLYGQAGYRRIEKRTLDRVLGAERRAIISVGGGVVSENETYEKLLGACYTVWVSASAEEHMARVMAQGDLRAMAENSEAMEDLRGILRAREPLYRRADFHLDTQGETIAASAEKLQTALETQFK